MKVLGFDLSPKELEILELIYKHRGMKAEQLYCALYPEKENRLTVMNLMSKEKPSQIKGIQSRYLKPLREKGLLRKASVSSNPGSYSFLTKNGLEFIKTYLDIPLGKHGTGFGSDYGDFDYELYKPPHRRINHHLGLIDLFITLDNLRDFFPQFDIDYRDNRYVSEKYPIQSSVKDDANRKYKKFMPDAEVSIGSKRYYVEIDTGTEYFEALHDKFVGYANYLDYIHQSGRAIADGILFITNDPKPFQSVRRWETITRAFFFGINGWETSVNLIVGSLADVYSIVIKEQHKLESFNDTMYKLKYYLNTEQYNTTGIKKRSIVKNSKIKFDNVFSVTDGDKAFVYERCDGFETIGFARILAFNSSYSKSNIEVIPVLYCFKDDFIPIPYKAFKNPGDAKILFANLRWLNAYDEPRWYDVDGERMLQGNPLKL
ncbi:hypothetical protein GCM10011351_26910 [Paraliobacillus quinghaiensis]|uniref:Replication-relaxation n=1 Tax=Paraliobacillus quinghaiensis TaxID=470815 RepID=A0A917TWT2_9BACI|nr:replication-relaxation family protein [Paraliobacillus quinghaiensis]GGM39356.1 hypothetical protein GCM10011351_26910 [Paraliobacillus quinghaiensis]